MENVKALPSSCRSVAWFESKAANLMRIRHIRRLSKINHCCRFALTGVNIYVNIPIYAIYYDFS